MLDGIRNFIKGIASSDSISINITHTEVTVNGKKVEGEAGAKIVHGVKDLFTEVDKAFDKVSDAMDAVGKTFDKVEEVFKTEREEKK